MKRILLASAAALTVGLSGAATALPLYIIDDYTTTNNGLNPIGPVGGAYGVTLQNAGDEYWDNADQSFHTYSLNGLNFGRRIHFKDEVDTNANPGTGTAVLGTGYGSLDFTTGVGVQASLTLEYDITSLYALVASQNSVKFKLTAVDGVNGTPLPTVAAYINGNLFGDPGTNPWNLGADPITLANQIDAGFTLTSNMLNGNSDILKFVITGPASMDLQFQFLALDVPEPGMLGLFGFGAIALGLARRRTK